ncbi:MAG: GIY-YIG nuclease family protein [Gammaproteobacteria bacterium]|nr:GIY-YIG nuclease family protein [Gammaproteobacteria bacterium]
MNEIPLSRIIQIDDPTQYKFHAARWNKSDQPLDVYATDKDEWHSWNTWKGSKDEFSREYIFSLIDFYHESYIWLFGGVYRVLERGVANDNSYKIKELPEFSPYVGRLKIKLPKLPRGRAFYLESHFNQMEISEILKQSYSGEQFPGYENINHPFSTLKVIFRQSKPDWRAALENIKGVYVITDKSNGKAYVGSAYGDSGIWSRWSYYIDTGHGWTKELAQIIDSQGPEYAENNFTFSLLEYRPMKTDDKFIIDRESYWKEVFLSRGKFGYNEN